MARYLQSALAVALSLASFAVCAQHAPAPGTPAATEAESPWRLGIALGYGERSNPLIVSEDIPVVADVDIAWFGKQWFFDNGDLGFTFLSDPGIAASLVARVNSDRVFFSKTNTRLVTVSVGGEPLAEPTELRVPPRSYAVELGIETLLGGSWGQLGISAFQDVSGTHDGYAVELDYSYSLHGQRWVLEPGIGLRYKSRGLADYFWGVRQHESNAALPAYAAGSALNLQGSLRASYYLNKRLRLVAAVNYERLGDAIAASPVVRERAVLGWFGGLAYEF